jgi:prepilin-type N-terminal cleavage/methylation domain-containing protein
LTCAIAALRHGSGDVSVSALPDALSKPAASHRHKTSRCLPVDHQPGFTLIETLIALMVFSVGMLGVSCLTTVIVRENTLSQQITTATVLAQDKLEALHNIGYDSLTNEHDITPSNRHPYQRAVSVTDGAPAPGMKTVAVTVSWGPHDAAHHVTLHTIIIEDL